MKTKVAILGSGTMGVDLAILAACHDFNVLLWHRNDSTIAHGRLLKRLDIYGAKEILDESEMHKVLSNTVFTDHLDDIKDVDVVVESIAEVFEGKKALLRQVSNIVSKGCVLVSNTSSFSIEDLSTCVDEPSRFAGFHFFNPALRMELIELVSSSKTSSDTRIRLQEIAREMGKTAVELRDSSGFVVNRLMACQVREAMLLLQEGVACAESVDTAVKLGLAHPIGPLALADLIGLDVMLAIFDSLSNGLGERFAPPKLLTDKVAGGMLGRKTRHGFFEY